LSDFTTENGQRRDVGPIIRLYFDDMFQVWLQHARLLKPGAVAACVVANSTFSRRMKKDGTAEEVWRLPVLTDVLLAHLALLAGFESVEILSARSLRARNATSA